MNIYIKSFNRPYFLDRCLATVYMKVSGFDRIIILDDGTPQNYLDKISEKYPEVEIRKSEFWEAKSAMIESENIDRTKLKFPGDFWYRETKDAEGYLLLLEDDFYITEDIDLEAIEDFMKKNNLLLYKLLWLGSPLLVNAKKITIPPYEILKASFTINSKHFRRLTNNTYRIRDFVTRFFPEKFYFKKLVLPFYNFYSVAGAVYNADYYRFLWKDIQKLNEYHQIHRTLEYYESNKIEKKVGKHPTEAIKTSWLSSATNEFEGIDFDVFKFNEKLNHKWLNNELNAIENYPFDYKIDYVSQFLSESEKEVYTKWVAKFKEPFVKYNCNTEDYGQ